MVWEILWILVFGAACYLAGGRTAARQVERRAERMRESGEVQPTGGPRPTVPK